LVAHAILGFSSLFVQQGAITSRLNLSSRPFFLFLFFFIWYIRRQVAGFPITKSRQTEVLSLSFELCAQRPTAVATCSGGPSESVRAPSTPLGLVGGHGSDER